jgi:hypothetical protein
MLLFDVHQEALAMFIYASAFEFLEKLTYG